MENNNKNSISRSLCRSLLSFTGHCCVIVLMILMMQLPTFAQNVAQTKVSGTVQDSKGEPLVGVSVVGENTTIGVSTNLDGFYEISLPLSVHTLVVSCIGYVTKRVPVSGGKTVNVVLEDDTQSLEEVVVVGYGVQKKESSVAAITQVTGSTLTSSNTTSITTALAGQIPGISVVQPSGMPGADGAALMIRGVSSWNSSSPLVLVDGVERNYNNIDPTEIETMSVLKDASATAVFGVRGANGVILITTKRGKAGGVKVNFSTEANFKQPINMVAPMNSYETALVINEARKNDNNWGSMLSDEVIEHYRTHDMPYVYPDTNWQDYMLQNAWGEKYNLNISGGTDFARVFASFSYLHDGDVIKTIKNDNYDPSFTYNRYNYRINVDMDVTPTTLVSLDAGGFVGVRNRPYETNNQRLFRPIFMLGPMDGVLFYPASVLNQYPDTVHPDETGERLGTTDLTNSENPLVANSYSGSSTITTSNMNLSIKLNQNLNFILEGLSFKASASYNNTTRWVKSISYDAVTYKLLSDGSWIRRVGRSESGREEPAQIPSVGTDGLDSGVPNKTYYYEVSLNYDRTFGKHAVTGMLVGQRRKTSTDAEFPSYQQGIAARATYTYNNKYLFEANLGYNGSEQFSPDKQYGFFPSFALGYNLHNEAFFKPLKKYISKAKIRASWGQVGSDAASERWLFTSSFVTGGGWNYTGGLPGSGADPLTPIVEEKAANLDATWEVATKKDLGLELSFFKQNYVVVNMDFFNEHRTGILLTRQSVPTYAGITSKQMNLGATKTKGYEIDVKLQYSTPDGKWYFFVNPSVSFSDNRITAKDEPIYTPAYQKEQGYRIGQIFAYHHTGWIQDADVAMTTIRYGSGLIGLGDTEYVDFNGDGIVDRNDMYAYGYTQQYPLYNYACNFGVTFKNFEFTCLLQAATDMNREAIDAFAWPLHRLSSQVFAYEEDVWSPTNRDARYPSYHFDVNRLHNNLSDGAFRDVSLYDASYLRVKTVNIAYNLPKKLISKYDLSSLRLYLRGNNIYTWCPGYPLGDPEASDGLGSNITNGYYPMTRTFTFGVQVGF